MTEWKTVCIFALLCCAAQVARASIVSTALDSSDNSIAQNSPVSLVSNDAVSATNWAVPSGLNLQPIRSIDSQSAASDVPKTMDVGASMWIASPTALSQPATLTADSDQTSDFHASPATMPLMSVASVAIPLPLAFPAGIAGLGLAVFFSVLWKKRSHPRD